MANNTVVVLSMAWTGHAQDIDAPVLRRARGCFAGGDTFSAVTEYKRYLYFCGDRHQKYHICHELSDSFRLHGSFEQSGHWLAQAADYADDTAKNGIYLAAVAAYINSNNISEATYNLTLVDTAGTETAARRDLFLYKGIVLLSSCQWDGAFSCLREYLAPCPCVLKSFEEWIRKNPPPKGKNPSLARLFSLLIPGAGQAYAGDAGGAVNGFILNTITGYPAVNAVLSSEWIDASLYVWLFTRFYFGGLEVAAEKAVVSRDMTRTFYTRKVLERLLEKVAPCYRESEALR